jgi:antitoxin component YwqK of YwqJK toxin-antitoxin module
LAKAKKKKTAKKAAPKKTKAKKISASAAKKKTIKKKKPSRPAPKKSRTVSTPTKTSDSRPEADIRREIESANAQKQMESSTPFPFDRKEKSKNKYKLLLPILLVVLLIIGYFFKRQQKDNDVPELPSPVKKELSAKKVPPIKEEKKQIEYEGDTYTFVKAGPKYKGSKQVRFDISCVDGELDEKCMKIWYYGSGKIKGRELYSDKKLNGLTTLYHYNGKISSKRMWSDHKRDEMLIDYDKNGKVILECEYNDGELEKGPKKCPSGTPKIPNLE